MSKKYLYLIILIMMIVNGVSLFRYINKKSDYNLIRKNANIYAEELTFLRKRFNSNFELKKKKINNFQLINYSKSNDSIYLSQLVNEKLFIVYVPLNEGTCLSCVNYTIEEANEQLQQISGLNPLIITSHFSSMIKPRIFSDDIYYAADLGELNQISNISSLPFYFSINCDLIIDNFYIPVSNDEESLYSYFDAIKREFNHY